MTTLSAKPYGFFLDTLYENPNTKEAIYYYNNTPKDSVIIGETDVAGQKKINDGKESKRFFGMSSAFWSGEYNAEGEKTPGPDAAKSWSLITAANTNNAIKNLTGKAKALAINEAALVYPVELDPSIRKEDPASWFYAQNFQIKYETKAAENYALVTTALWAANQLYPNTKIIPVFDSYYVNGLNLNPDIVGQVNALTAEIGIPALTEFNNQPPTKLGKQWNMLSTLFNNNKLIDGWIGDIYGSDKTTPPDKSNEEGKLPTPGGKNVNIISPFNPSVELPYVLQSRSDYLDQKSKLPITSDYYDPMGIMPFHASIDFNGDLTVPPGYSPSSKLTPVSMPYPTKVFAPINSLAPIFNPISPLPESIVTSDRYTQFTDADDVLTNQSNIKYRLMGGDDYLGVIGGLNNYANGNKGEDKFVLRGGIGEYLGGKDSDTFEVIDADDGTLISANRGADIITGSVSGVIYRGGKDNDLIAVSQGEAWGDLGDDVFRGVTGEGYAVIQDYTIGEDVVELEMAGNWSNIDSGLMFTDTSGDKLMLLLGINDVEQVTRV
ncbi:hypothetical protein OAK57_04795 [Synechococcus sp. AH-551-N23]|nr:hypothetical protein [Synechococcus sp. AH-551-N23]